MRGVQNLLRCKVFSANTQFHKGFVPTRRINFVNFNQTKVAKNPIISMPSRYVSDKRPTEADILTKTKTKHEQEPEKVDPYLQRAKKKLEYGDLNGALQDYNESISQNALNPIAFVSRGDLHVTLRNFNLAIDDFTRATNLQPSFVPAYAGIAFCKLQLGLYQEAIQEYSDALHIYNKFDYLYGGRGEAYLLLQMPNEAISDFQQVLKINSSNIEAKIGLGKAFLQLNDVPTAKQYIEEALELQNKSPEAWEALGTLEYQQGNISQAISAFSKSLQYNPNNINLLVLRAYINREQGNPKEAFKDVQQIMKIDPLNVEIFLLSARCRFDLGDFERAAKDVEKHLKHLKLKDTANYPVGFDPNQLRVEALAVKCQCYMELFYQIAKPAKQVKYPKEWESLRVLNTLANESMNKLRKEPLLTMEKKYLLTALESALEAVSLQQVQDQELINFVKLPLFYINNS